MTPEFKSSLKRAGIAPGSLQPLSIEKNEGILIAKIEGGASAISLWAGLRGPMTEAGFSVFLLREESDLERLKACVDSSEQTIAEILNAAARASGLELLREEKEAQRVAAQKWLEEEGLDDDKTRRDDVFSRGEPWPDEPPGADGVFDTPFHYSVPFDFSPVPRPNCFIGFVPTRDPFEIPAYLRFGGYNENPSPHIHIAMLRDWNRRYTIMPACFRGEVIECSVGNLPQTPEEARILACVQFEYCPDIVEQGTGTVERLAHSLWKSPVWYFWWD